MNVETYRISDSKLHPPPLLGTYGHLTIFTWFLAMIMIVKSTNTMVITMLCLGVAAIIYPFAFRRILNWRWIIMMSVLAVPAVFLLGEIDSNFRGIAYSAEGLDAGIQIASRFIVVLLAVEALTRSVNITAVGGMLERIGMQGLGFSIGVGLNLLPSLQNACLHTWQSLRMRGGFRRYWWRGLKLMTVTIISNAITQAEEVALAAEARAFSPEKSRPLPIKKGQFDWLAISLCILSILGMIFI